MPSASHTHTPGLSSFLKSLGSVPLDDSLENLISLLKRRQIRHSRACAVATAYLLLRVASAFRGTDVQKLIERIQQVGRRLTEAQPREMVVGNIVRRVLGLIRDEVEDDRENEFSLASDAETDSGPATPVPVQSYGALEQSIGALPDRAPVFRPSLITSHTSFAPNASQFTSMFNILSHPTEASNTPQPGSPVGSPSPSFGGSKGTRDVRGEVIAGIQEIIDELTQVDDQIASYALEHIHSNEVILTYTSSVTVQKFLLKAAAKRQFTVIHAESHPNNHAATHATVTGQFTDRDEDSLSADSFRKPLAQAGITVILIPDSAVFALMSRVNKVILGTHAVLANGGLVAAAGARVITQAAKTHQIPVVVVSGIFKLSPVYPFDFESLIEYGDPNAVVGYEEGEFVESVEVENPLFDYVPAEMVDLYITNLGGHAPSYLHRIVSDHYRTEDIHF